MNTLRAEDGRRQGRGRAVRGISFIVGLPGLLALVLLGAGVGCDAGSDARDAPDALYPEWVTEGSYAKPTEDGSVVFVGVGSASGIRSQGLLRAAADNRARAEVARLLEHRASGEAPAVVRRRLVGVQIVVHWAHPEDGTLYARAELVVPDQALSTD